MLELSNYIKSGMDKSLIEIKDISECSYADADRSCFESEEGKYLGTEYKKRFSTDNLYDYLISASSDSAYMSPIRFDVLCDRLINNYNVDMDDIVTVVLKIKLFSYFLEKKRDYKDDDYVYLEPTYLDYFVKVKKVEDVPDNSFITLQHVYSYIDEDLHSFNPYSRSERIKACNYYVAKNKLVTKYDWAHRSWRYPFRTAAFILFFISLCSLWAHGGEYDLSQRAFVCLGLLIPLIFYARFIFMTLYGTNKRPDGRY